jgi:hypothetical protein
MRLENVIFSNLVNNEDYARKVIPFLKGDYFSDKTDQVVFELIDDHVTRYKGFPSPEALVIDRLHHSEKVVTTIIVASRPSTIALADEVVFIEHGKLSDQGAHSSLLLRNENYRLLMQSFEHDREQGGV